MVLLAPACPGCVRTPTLLGSTPKLLEPEAETQAACLTDHLSASTPAGLSCLVTLSFVLCDALKDKSEVSPLNALVSFLKNPHCLLHPAACPLCKSVLLQGLHLFLSACLSVTTSFPGVQLCYNFFPVFSHTLAFPLHRLSPPNTFTFSPPSLSLSLLVYISCSLCLSLLTYCRRSA